VGICISGSVYDQIRNKIALSSKLLGEQKYKNIPQLVRTYSITESESDDTPSPGEMFAASNIPIRVPAHFMGRDDALAAVETALARYEGRVAITALHGLRGIGKTTLAAAYADLHRGNYRATWWIRAQTEPSMRADLVALGVRLGWAGAEDKEEPALATVMERLRHEGEAILLIFDNAIDANAIKPYLPRGGSARVLVTSNAHAWRGVAAPVEIRLWPKEIGADYLVARTGRDKERTAAEALSEALGGLPLAHEQAAAYCERLDIAIAEYGRRFAAAPARLLDDARHAPAEYHDGLTVTKTFALAIEEAAKLHSGAEPLIVHAALLAPEPIPLVVFAEGRDKFGDPLTTALAGDGLDEAVAALRAFALIDREVIADERDSAITIEAIRLHRLVREVVAARHESKAREDARHSLVEALVAVFPQEGVRNPPSWPRCALLTPHILAICGPEIGAASAAAECADLLNRAGGYFHGRGAFSAARPLKERALAIRERVFGPEHHDTARSLGSLALLFRDQGDNAQARPLAERALAIQEKVHGPEHTETAIGLTDVALVLKAEGDYAAARLLIERSLAIRERVFGPEHHDTAVSLHVLALLLWNQGDLAQVRPLLERSLAIFEKTRGPEHPFTTFVVANLAGALQEQGDFAGARLLAERALATQEKTRGPDHIDTAKLLSNLASVLRDQGDLAGARPLLERALSINEKTLGLNHSWTKTSARALAELLDALGRAEEAATIRERFGSAK
jgi:tetratricopeptide (TPR) repeat protein